MAPVIKNPDMVCPECHPENTFAEKRGLIDHIERQHPHRDAKKDTKHLKDRCPFCKKIINAVHYHKQRCSENTDKDTKKPSKTKKKVPKEKMVDSKKNEKEEKNFFKKMENHNEGEKAKKKEQEDQSSRELECEEGPSFREPECDKESVNREEMKNKSKTKEPKIKVEIQDAIMAEPEDHIEEVNLVDDEENKIVPLLEGSATYEGFLIQMDDAMEKNVVLNRNAFEKQLEDIKKFHSENLADVKKIHSAIHNKLLTVKEDKYVRLEQENARQEKIIEDLRTQIDSLKKRNDVALFLEKKENTMFRNSQKNKIWIPMDDPGEGGKLFKGPHGMEFEQTKGPTLDVLAMFQKDF